MALVRKLIAPTAAGSFSPSDLFPANGSYYDCSDLTSLWQDSARTTQVSADGDLVGCIDDLSANGNHIVQSTSGARPRYKTSGGLHWVEQHTGTGYFMNFPNFVSSWTSGTSITAMRSDAGNGASISKFGTSGQNNHEPFSGSIYSDFGSSTRPAFGSFTTNTLAVITRVSGSASLKVYVDKVQSGSTATITVAFGTAPSLFSAFNGTAVRFYGGIFIEGTLSAGDLADAETWCGNLQGRSI